MNGTVTLHATLFQRICTRAGARDATSQNYNSGARFDPAPDSKSELFPLHSPLLRESWLVSFPPLNNMLKFSG